MKKFQQLLLDYNGSDHMRIDYENIKAVVCDAGGGGQIIGGVMDYMLSDWEGNDGKLHKGIIDASHKSNETARDTFPDAIDIVRLIDPKGRRNEIFESLEKMVKLGVVTLPAEWDGKDELFFLDDDGTEHHYQLSMAEQDALGEIENLRNETVTMCKYVSNGNVTYNFPPDKRNTMQDDRVIMFGLLCYFLASLRRGQMVSTNDYANDEFATAPSLVSTISFT